MNIQKNKWMKLATISVAIVAITGVGTYAAIGSLAKPKEASITTPLATATKTEVAEVSQAEPKAEVKESTTPAPKVVEQQTTPEPEPEPVILTTQQYAEKYLDLSKAIYQTCFDTIVTVWPHRFTPDVREQNVRALRIWASPCSTGMLSVEHFEKRPSYMDIVKGGYKDGKMGMNGEWFDTDLAKAYR